MKYLTALPYFPEEDIDLIINEIRLIFEGKALFAKGPKVKEFENSFAKHIGSKFAIAVNSGTSALEVALNAINLNEGDEVIVPVQTFVSTGSCVVSNNATPVFAEVNKNHLLDFDDLIKKISPRTKAVIIVHFAGLIHEQILEIKEYLNGRNILLIEDAAHAHGAKFKNLYAGNIGDIGCFSFYSTKVMTTAGEGGLITSNNEQVAKRCASIRAIGIDIEGGHEKYSAIGSNKRMSEIQAIVGLHQLKRLEQFVKHRNLIANIYREELVELENSGIIEFQDNHSDTLNSYWRFVINLKNAKISRELLKTKLRNKGINIDWPYQPLMHLQPVFRKLYGFSEYDFPKSARITNAHFCLPMHLNLSPEDAKYISLEVKNSIL